MKRNVFVLIDETKNEFIGCQIANSKEDILIQLNNYKQKDSFDVKVSCYWLSEINLDDDNVFSRRSVTPFLEEGVKVWSSIETDVSNNVKSDVMEEDE